ncbi:MAG: hypothetical protein ACRYFK_15975 [Janthinobacterium lividum]
MPLSAATLRLENAAGQVLTHPTGYVVLIYKPGPRTLPDLQALITRITELLRTYNWYRILGDQRLMAPLTTAQTEWLVHYWQQHGPLYAAVILAQDVFARLAASQLKQQISDTGITYRQFADEAAAVRWLGQIT